MTVGLDEGKRKKKRRYFRDAKPKLFKRQNLVNTFFLPKTFQKDTLVLLIRHCPNNSKEEASGYYRTRVLVPPNMCGFCYKKKGYISTNS